MPKAVESCVEPTAWSENQMISRFALQIACRFLRDHHQCF
jgi:hypothetical protein